MITSIPTPTITDSDYSDVILAVQRALTLLGYYDGPLDGVVGPQTKKAIRWFQFVDRLPATGEIDPPTLRALLLIASRETFRSYILRYFRGRFADPLIVSPLARRPSRSLYELPASGGSLR